MRRKIRLLFAFALAASVGLSFSGCPIFRAAGSSVEAVGEGAGHAVAGTGRAIERAAD